MVMTRCNWIKPKKKAKKLLRLILLENLCLMPAKLEMKPDEKIGAGVLAVILCDLSRRPKKQRHY